MKNKRIPPLPFTQEVKALHQKIAKTDDPSEKITLLEQVIKLQPTHLPSLKLRAYALAEKQDFVNARAAFKTLSIMQPKEPAYLYQFALLAARTKQLHDAVCAAQRLVELQPNKAQNLNLLAGLYGTLRCDELNRYWGQQLAYVQPLTKESSTERNRLNVLVLGTKASGSFVYNPTKLLVQVKGIIT